MDSLNDLIAMAQSLLNNGFDMEAFLTWKSLAFLALLGLLGPFHYYTRNFTHLTAAADKHGLLAGEGLLSAAKEEVARRLRKRETAEYLSPPKGLAAHNAKMAQRKKWYPLCIVQQCHHN
jgi:hypothetical protein